MMKNDLRDKIKIMVAELRDQIEQYVPDEGDFPMVYSEFKTSDKGLCLTDVILKFRPIPDHLPAHETQRWLEVVGYKLPVPYKSSMVIFKGMKQDTIAYLRSPEAEEKILNVITKLDYNLKDV